MKSDTNVRRKAKRRVKQALWQMVLVIVLLSLIWFSFGQNVLSTKTATGSMPPRLGALRLVEQSEGQEAVAAVSRLHSTDIGLETAYIGTYARDNETATVWVGKAASTTAATELMRRMVEGIGTGTSGFGNLKVLSITQGYHDHEVYQVEGPGGKHFFYVSKLSPDEVVWLTVQAEQAGSLLETAINTF